MAAFFVGDRCVDRWSRTGSLRCRPSAWSHAALPRVRGGLDAPAPGCGASDL